MSSHFSDDRDVLPEPINHKPRLRRRYATAGGKLTIATLFLLVCALSVVGGIIANRHEISNHNYSYRSQDFYLCRGMELIVGLWIFAVGSSVGSFLNVVAWRGPRGMSINGHSFCPRCKVPISSIDNIPIIGWLRLRGRCLTCRLPISKKYPIFEVICGAMYLILFVVEFLSHGRNLPIIHPANQTYGLPLQLTDISMPLVWTYAVHVAMLSCLLAIFMARNNGDTLPMRFVMYAVIMVSAMMAIEPAACNVNLLSLTIEPAQHRLEVIQSFSIKFGLALCIAGLAYAWSTYAHRIPADNPMQDTVSESNANAPSESIYEITRINDTGVWFAIVLLLLISLGILPGIAVLLVASMYAKLNGQSKSSNSISAPFQTTQGYLVTTAFLFLLSWRSLASLIPSLW